MDLFTWAMPNFCGLQTLAKKQPSWKPPKITRNRRLLSLQTNSSLFFYFYNIACLLAECGRKYSLFSQRLQAWREDFTIFLLVVMSFCFSDCVPLALLLLSIVFLSHFCFLNYLVCASMRVFFLSSCIFTYFDFNFHQTSANFGDLGWLVTSLLLFFIWLSLSFLSSVPASASVGAKSVSCSPRVTVKVTCQLCE